MSAPPVVHEVLRSPGQPLPSSVRTFFESRFGADFSQVRVHTDAAAQQSAQDINANAYTVGPNIVFGRGRFAAETEGGRRLLAHELTHTLQQKNGVSVQLSALISHRDDPAEREAESIADNWMRAPENAAPPAIRQRATSVIQRDGKAGFGNNPHAVTDPGFGSQLRVVGKAGFGNQPHVVNPRSAGGKPQPEAKAGFGDKPHAVTPKAGDEPQADDNETLAEALAKAGFPQQPAAARITSWSPADNIERFKEIWIKYGRAAFETYAHDLLEEMWNTGGLAEMDKFADGFWDYVWKQIGGQITTDPNNQMMLGIAATIVLQQKTIKEEVEARKRYIAVFEEQARRYTKEVLKQSQERVLGELKHYFGASWIRNYIDPGGDPRTQADDRAARKALGIAAAGLVKRRDALIKANAPYREFVRSRLSIGWKPIEDAVNEAGRDYEVFRLQVVARFPILEEISSPEIDAFRYEDAEPDDAEGQQLKNLAKMAQDGNMAGFEFIVTTIREKLSNIEKVREEIEPGGDINIWRVPELVQGTRDRMGVKRGSVEAELIDSKFEEENQPRNESESILGQILLWGGLILAPFTEGLSLVPFGIYEAGKVGSAIYEHVQEYQTATALHGTDFGAAAISAEDPSLFWLAGDILNAGLAVINLAPLGGPAVRIFRRLAPFARLAREVQAGEEALIALKNEAKAAATQELKLGVDEASNFAESVAADARAAQGGGALGMTADEARMLAEAEPVAAKAATTQLDVLAAQPAPMTVGEQTARVEGLLAKQRNLNKGITQANSNQISAGKTIDKLEEIEAAGTLKPKQAEELKAARERYEAARKTETDLRAELQTVEADLTTVRRQTVQPTSWAEHESAVFQRQIADHPGAAVGEQVTFHVTDTATGKTVEIQIDVAVFENGEVKLVDAKFSAKTDLTQGAIGDVYTPNQNVVYRWISGGNEVTVIPRGANARSMGLTIGQPVKVSRTIEVHVNSPEGIRVRDFKETL